MKKHLLAFLFIGNFITVAAQTEIDLYKKEIPNSKPCSLVENSPAQGRVQQITIPKLYVYQPAVKDSAKTAVIICPGGGYGRLAINHEGHEVAKAFNAKGVTAFVLKYRNPIDSACFINKEIVALQDAQRAIQLLRENAVEYNIDANKIGIMGFSAGGHLASTAATHFTTTTIENSSGTNLRPSFAILIYPVISLQDSIAHMGSRNNLLGKNPTKEKIDLYSNELQVTAQTPPIFLLHAGDDKSVVVMNSINFYMALLKNKVPAEMVLQQAGGHGFGLNNKAEPINWLNNVFGWMSTNKFLKGNVQ